jgi:hypothetical protein
MLIQARGVALLLIGLLVIGALAGACSRGDDGDAAEDVSVELVVEPLPLAVGPATVTVRLRDADGEPINGAELEIVGDMTHAGMVPVITGATDEGDGRYVSEGFEFTMGGDWIITVRGTLPGGQQIERTFDVEGVAS